jgi:hypothetical protein
MIVLVLTMNPRFEPWPRASALAGMLAALALPVVLEWVGVLPRTFRFDDAGIHMVAPGDLGGATISAIIIILSTVIVSIVAVVVGHGIRVKDAETRRRMHLQAWQLRQLVPDIAV